ncbi:MAG: RNA polymerase sigma factor [Bacteroidia bacterium]
MFFRKKSIPTTEDPELLLLYRQTGDMVYVGELFKKYSRLVLGTCAFYLEDKDEAKDAVMQIFDKLIIELKKREVENFKAWLGFVTRNYCISIIRKRKTDRNRMADYYEFEKQEANDDTENRIADVSDDEFMEELLKESITELKEGQRICVQLFYLNDKSYQQIAEETAYSINEVKSYIQNGKRNLKLLIEEKRKLAMKNKNIPAT